METEESNFICDDEGILKLYEHSVLIFASYLFVSPRESRGFNIKFSIRIFFLFRVYFLEKGRAKEGKKFKP